MKKIPLRNFPDELYASTDKLFRIRTLQELAGASVLKQDPHRHSYFLILAISKGKGIHIIDFTPYSISDQTVFVMRPGQVHSIELEAGSSGFMAEFHPSFYYPSSAPMVQHFRRAVNLGFCKPDQISFTVLEQLMQMMHREYTNKATAYQEALQSWLNLFFLEYIRNGQPRASGLPVMAPYQQMRFDEFSELLEKHFKTRKQVADYSRQMSLSDWQLNAISKAVTGKPISEQITTRLMLEARRLLLATTLQVKEISLDLGYEDVSYFIRYFKKHSGLSPEAFRQRHR